MAGQAERFTQQTAYMKHDNTLYGRTNGIFFNVQYASLSIAATVRAFIKRDSGIDLFGINGFLKENKKKYHAADAQTDGRSVWVTLNSSTVLKAETTMEFLNEFSSYLVGNGYSSSCNLCTNTENLGYTEQDGQVMEVCEACHEKLQGAVEEIKAQRETTGSYAKGAVGAVLGGIVGIVPWVLIGMLGYVAAFSGLIMAWLSYKGYQLLGGKKGRGMVWVLVIVLIVFTYVGVMASQMVTDANLGGFELTGNAILIYLMAPFLPEYFYTEVIWGQLALGWLFAGLGSFGLIRKANKEASGKDLEVKRVGKE